MSKDKIYFKNREEAAYKLLEILPIDSMRLEEWTVIACSYGGYEIAKIVADSLDAEFDIMFNEKIYAPQNDECEIAVVTELEEVLIHEELVKAFDINLDSIYIMSKEIYKDNIRPIAYRFRNGEKFQNLAGKNVLIFLEVVFAADFTADAVEVFETKKRIKLFSQGTKYLELANDSFDFKRVDGGFVYQEADKVADDEVKNSKLMSSRAATLQEIKDMEIAYKIASLTKSNCVVYVKNSAMVAVGMGMTSRVDASKAALRKASDMGLDVNGAVLASEAFFPFRDSIDEAQKAGVKCVIEPGGSIRDDEIIEAANEYGMALYFSGIRHFLH